MATDDKSQLLPYGSLALQAPRWRFATDVEVVEVSGVEQAGRYVLLDIRTLDALQVFEKQRQLIPPKEDLSRVLIPLDDFLLKQSRSRRRRPSE